MTRPHRTALALGSLCCGLAAMPALAADGASLTLYRSDSPALYTSHGEGKVDDGHAVVREQRTLTLKRGVQDLTLDKLPDQLDAEALALTFPDGAATVLAQRLQLAQGSDAALAGLVGREVTVLGENGQPFLEGKLLRVSADGLVVHSSSGDTLVHQYAAVRASDGGIPGGASLILRLDAKRAGQAAAVLSYPAAGLGWRAAYVAALQPGASCRMQFAARASIANRSGRDWHDAHLTLIAGSPSFAKAAAPRPMMLMAKAYAAAPLPEQAQLDNYRSYTLPTPVDLPDGSVSQLPLYATRELACTRTNLYEDGGNWQPAQPMLGSDFNSGSNTGAIYSTLKLTALDSLPAGYLRVLAQDAHGTPQFIGEGRLNDTPKGTDATITLGTAFDLRATRERTSFHVDRAGRTLDEGFRITLTNSGAAARTVIVREHPNRWREWSLASSNEKPDQQTTDTLSFRVDVPANGKAVLDYAVRYHWTAAQQPQG